MIRPCKARRRQGGDNPLGVGSIYYLQDGAWFRDRLPGRPVCKNPWIAEAFLNGVYGGTRRDQRTGHWRGAFISGRSDPAVVRSLRAAAGARWPCVCSSCTTMTV